MNATSAIKVIIACALALVTGTPLPVVLLELASGLSGLITPADVAAAAKILEGAGKVAEAETLRAIYALARLPKAQSEPSAQLDASTGPAPAIVLDQEPPEDVGP